MNQSSTFEPGDVLNYKFFEDNPGRVLEVLPEGLRVRWLHGEYLIAHDDPGIITSGAPVDPWDSLRLPPMQSPASSPTSGTAPFKLGDILQGMYGVEVLVVGVDGDNISVFNETMPTLAVQTNTIAHWQRVGYRAVGNLPPDHPRMQAHLPVELPGGYVCARGAFDKLVEREVAITVARNRARDLVKAAEAPPTPRPPIAALTEFLAVPDEPVAYRVSRLMSVGARIVLTAPYKSGKTTLVGNLLRCLADGDDFLGMFEVTLVQRVLLLDNELDDRMLRRWLREQGIQNTRAIDVVSLKGRLSSFNILDPQVRAEWGALLEPADLLVFDCLRPALDALGLSEDKEAGRFLVALDELVREAGIAELLLVHHMGHANNRSRGDSRILDWPDATWTLTRDKDADDETVRDVYFKALGRDVDEPARLLQYEAATRHLTLTTMSRSERASEPIVAEVIAYVEANPGASGKAIEDGLGGRRDNVRKAVDQAVDRGLIYRQKDGVAKRHYPISPTSPNLAPASGRGPVLDLAHSPIGRGARENEHAGESYIQEELAQGETTVPIKDPPAGRACTSCGAPLNPLREAYGKTQCVDCERTAS